MPISVVDNASRYTVTTTALAYAAPNEHADCSSTGSATHPVHSRGVMLYLVRHAKAGSRHNWKGDDRLRPLSANGQRQAQALATQLAALGVKSLISSPYLRCIETLQPTAQAIDAAVATDECLGEGRSFVEVLELMASLPDGAVLCSHGDVIPETIAALERRGCEFTSPAEWRKASVWVLDRNADGEIISAEAWPPPDVS